MLGPLEVAERGAARSLGGMKQRAVLGILLVHRREVCSSERLIDELWGERPPASAAKTLQGYVSQLRKVLGDGVLRTQSRGYQLVLGTGELDVDEFEQLVAEGRHALSGDPAVAAERLRQALALWRGPALADFVYEPFAQAEISRLEEARLAALEDLIEAQLACGRNAEVIGELEGLIRAQPLRERLRTQLMLALYRSGRQAEALDAFQDARRVLVEELGIEPSRPMRELHQAILEQDPTLESQARPAIAKRGLADVAKPSEQGAGLRTFLIADIRGYTRFTEEQGDQASSVLTERFAEITREVVQASGGAVVEFRGDEALAVFESARTAIATAIELQRRLVHATLSDESLPLPVGVGLDAGEAVLVADGYRGGALNLASRLCGVAKAGEILASKELAHLAGHVPGISYEERGPVQVKNLSQPVQVVRITPSEDDPAEQFARRSAAAEPRKPRVAIADNSSRDAVLGRAEQLQQLRSGLDAIFTDRAVVFMIGGEAGIGKSRLADELARDARDRGARVVWGRCWEAGGAPGYWPWVQVLRSLLDGQGNVDLRAFGGAGGSSLLALIPEQGEASVTQVTPAAESEVARFRLFDAVAWVVRQAAAAQPLVIVLDDLHAADTPSLLLLQFLAGQLGTRQ